VTKELKTILMAVVLVGGIAGNAVARQDDPKLDDLFDQLQLVESPHQAVNLTHLIWGIWSASGSATTDLLFRRGAKALATGDLAGALTRFTAVTEIDPEFAEGWNKRATVLFMMGDLEGSIADVRRTLALEPRHFGALSGLGMIYSAQDKYDEAVAAFRRALAANPHLPGARESIKRLKVIIDGQKI